MHNLVVVMCVAITGDGRPFVSGLDAAKILPQLPAGQYAQVEVGRNFICGGYLLRSERSFVVWLLLLSVSNLINVLSQD